MMNGTDGAESAGDHFDQIKTDLETGCFQNGKISPGGTTDALFLFFTEIFPGRAFQIAGLDFHEHQCFAIKSDHINFAAMGCDPAVPGEDLDIFINQKINSGIFAAPSDTPAPISQPPEIHLRCHLSLANSPQTVSPMGNTDTVE